MNQAVFYSSLVIIAIISLFIGKKQEKKIAEYKEYFLGNRKLKVMPLTLSFLATQLGGGAILGAAEASYNYGWNAIYYSLGISIGFFILAMGVGQKFRKLEVSTIPEIFSKIYNSKSLQIISSVILIFATFLILLALGVATRKFFLALGISNEFWFIGFWAVIICYTTIGGFNAVVKTDILQVLFILITFLLIFIYVIFNANVPSLTFIISQNPPEGFSLPWNSWLLMPMLFTVIGQDMGQRCFAASKPKLVSISTALAGTLLIIASCLPVGLGILAKSYNLELSNASVLIQLVEIVTNPVLASLFAASVLLAILSTADSLICSISSNISCDIIESIKIKSFKLKSNIAKFITIAIGISAVALSLFAESIIEIMVISYSFAVSALFVPVFATVTSSNNKVLPIKAAFYTGIVSFVLFSILWEVPYKELLSLISASVAFAIAGIICNYFCKVLKVNNFS